MKQHEFKDGDKCVHCHGTSSTGSECTERRETIPVHLSEVSLFDCDCPICHYMREDAC
jgi:hypothetical protein